MNPSLVFSSRSTIINDPTENPTCLIGILPFFAQFALTVAPSLQQWTYGKMRRLDRILACCLMTFTACVSARADEQAESQWQTTGRELIGQFCVDCHNSDYQEAELDLQSYMTVVDLQNDRKHWENILRRIQFNSMPPEDAEQPDDQQREALVTAIERIIYDADCDLNPKPGHVTVRRLNRAEYNNTITDIFEQDLRPADAFPSDEVGAGFDNNGDVLSLPPMLFEKYIAAAEEVAAKVVVDLEDIEKIDIERSGDELHGIGKTRIGSFYKFYMEADGVVWCEITAPSSGEYRIELDGSAGKEGQHAALGLYQTDGKRLATFELAFADGGGSHSKDFKLQLDAGIQRLFVSYADSEAELPETLELAGLLSDEQIREAREAVGKPLNVDRDIDQEKIAFAIKRFSVAGPRGIPEFVLTPRHYKLVKDRPGNKKSAADAARPGLTWLLRRAFRGPVDEITVDRYAELVSKAYRREENFERAMRVGVAAVLVSPRFLFRVELPPTDSQSGQQVALDDHQIASRLSYFLWSSTPDERLLDLADLGRLTDPEILGREVKRMLKDERSSRLADNFAAQWLGLRNLDTVEPDPSQFAEFTADLRASMMQETRLTFLDMLNNNLSVLDLLDSDQTHLNQSLATLYGIPNIEGPEFRPVSLADTNRRGILTQASILTLTSNPTRTSPVKRGKWILENVLGTPPPEAPPGVPVLEESGKADPTASIREQLELHRADPGCASCHEVMDALGFGFENFDAIGKYRDTESSGAIDASGTLPGGVQFDGAVELVKILKAKHGEQFVNTTTARLMTFALGRELRFEDRCVVDDIVAAAKVNDYRFCDLVAEVVLSPLFRFQQVEGN